MAPSRRDFLSTAAMFGALAPLVPASALAQRNVGDARLMEGPMIGAVTPTTIRIWGRASDEYGFAVEYGTTPDLRDARRSQEVTTSRSNDYTAVTVADGLDPDTTYYYRVLLDGQGDDYLRSLPPFAVKTAPAAGARVAFAVATGSCARYARDPVQPIWQSIERYKPDLFVWMGDNMYGDSLNGEALAAEYRRQRSVPTFQAIGRTAPQLAVWDDHDYGLNNHDKSNPVKETALELFRQYWANPGYGLPDVPGVFFTYSYGGVDFFFLDGRYHRDPNAVPDHPGKTFLGAGQLAWLKERLEASSAPFKVLISGSGWSKAKGPGGDSWASYLHERDALFDFIRDREIGGVVLLSGDTHVGELNAIPWSARGGYDLYDLVSSPLAQNPEDSWLERAPELRIRPVFAGSPNFGWLEFDLRDRDARLSYTVVDWSGRPVWQPLVLRASELTNRVRSWTEKIDDSLRDAYPLVTSTN